MGAARIELVSSLQEGASMRTEASMRTDTHAFLARLPARKGIALIMLFALVCGGLIAGGAAFT
jgi:hypothetical protein